MSQSSLTLIQVSPDVSELPTLADHQSSTPASFTQEVLHFRTTGAKITLSSDQKFLLPAWFPDAASNDISVDVEGTAPTKGKAEEGGEDDEDWEDEDAIVEDVHVEDVTVIVTTKQLTLYSNAHAAGYQIPYPSISLHAITSTPTTSGIYMQINTHTTSFDDHDYSSLEITIYPPQTTLTTSAEGGNVTGSTKELFEALAQCSDLHPDVKSGFFGGGEDDEGAGEGDDAGVIYFDHNATGDVAGGGGITFLGGADEVGGIPALAPGGWITAENVDRIQWTIDGQSGVGDPNNANLGPGAGNIRRRDDDDTGGVELEGVESNGAGTKWRRTES
ncbi:hypothetical protein TWF281_005446 [Arthrobotrys megalospora]